LAPVSHYCTRCKPAYDERFEDYNDTLSYYRVVPGHTVEITEDGKDINPQSDGKEA
jgi:hypothetical protein